MKQFVIFVLCVALVFGAVALPSFFGSTLSGLTTVAQYATEMLLPATINPENIPVTREIAVKINMATGKTIFDVSKVPAGGLVENYVLSSNLYLNTSDGYNYIIIRKFNWLSSVPLIGSRLTYKSAIPAVVPALGLVYGLNGFGGINLDITLGGMIKSFNLQETNINAINWIEENW